MTARGEGRFLELYARLVVACAVGGLAALSANWLLEDDPATRATPEPESLGAELAELRRVPLGEFVQLNDSSALRWVLGPGFSQPESDGTWVQSGDAYLIFSLADADAMRETALELEISVSPHLTGDQLTRELQVWTEADRFGFDLGVGGARIVVPLSNASEHVVRFVCNDLDYVDQRRGPDLRKLCVKVFGIELRMRDSRS